MRTKKYVIALAIFGNISFSLDAININNLNDKTETVANNATGLFKDHLKYFDDVSFMYLLPLFIIIITLIYLIRERFFYKLNIANKTTQQLEDELTYKPKTLWGKIKQYF